VEFFEWVREGFGFDSMKRWGTGEGRGGLGTREKDPGFCHTGDRIKRQKGGRKRIKCCKTKTAGKPQPAATKTPVGVTKKKKKQNIRRNKSHKQKRGRGKKR